MRFFIFAVILISCDCVLCEEKESATDKSVVVKSKQKEVKSSSRPAKSNYESASKSKKLICPGNDISPPFFSIPCKVTKECTQLGNKKMLCCNNQCMKGVPAPPEEPNHSPALFGLVERVCPNEYIPELFEIKQCTKDEECSPRICCPEKMKDGETVGFCRTAEPKLDNIPVARPLMEPLRQIMSYMQCTPPPPPILDLFPKECKTPLDCFPNLCCQERGKRYCRPARRSLLTLITTVAERIVPSETAREFINRIAS